MAVIVMAVIVRSKGAVRDALHEEAAPVDAQELAVHAGTDGRPAPLHRADPCTAFGDVLGAREITRHSVLGTRTKADRPPTLIDAKWQGRAAKVLHVPNTARILAPPER